MSLETPAFWLRPPGLASRLLAPLGAVYGALTVARMRRPGVRLPIPVIAIGNLTAGGAGKTPTAIALAAALRAAGRAPAFVSRGHGGAHRGPLVVDPRAHDARTVGDEALLLARAAPTVIGRDRAAAGRLAATLADCLILDDGLQNPALAKDVTLCVIDGEIGLGNGAVLPAGPLRAPVAAQAGHIDVILTIGGAGDAIHPALAGINRHRGAARLDPAVMAALADRPCLAFAGIGRPQKFFDHLLREGVRLVGARGFGDHHAFSDAEIAALIGEAQRLSATLVTTEKDVARLGPSPAQRRLAERAIAAPLTIDAPECFAAIVDRLSRLSPGGAARSAAGSPPERRTPPAARRSSI
jgi:tetraacyldisaccharide 4'-kinase